MKFRSYKNILIISVIVSVSIEFLQFLISANIGVCYKSANIDDVILFVIGSLLGCMLINIVLNAMIKHIISYYS